MKVLVSNEFYELFRGDKDFIIPRLIAHKLGHEVFILCPTTLSISDQNAGFAFSKEIFVARLGLGPDAVKFHSPLRWIRKTHNKRMPFLLPLSSYFYHLLKIRPDVVVDAVYTTLTPRSFLNWIYCALFRKRRLLLDAGDEGRNRWLMPCERQAMRSAQKIFTYSQGGAARIAAKYGIDDPGKFFVHLKLLDPNRFRLLEEFMRPDFSVGYVGRFVRAKGFDRYLELANTFPNRAVRFRAVGPNTDGFTIPANLEHSDYVENSRLAEIYSAIDLLVLPDMRNFLGFYTVIQEALMCGTEVAVGTLNRAFFPTGAGVFFFDPDRPTDLTAFIARRAQQTFAEKIAGRKALAEDYRQAADESGFLSELDKQLSGHA